MRFKQGVVIEVLTAERVTAQETWAHHYKPNIKCQSMGFLRKIFNT